jgi:hypothetical protein
MNLPSLSPDSNAPSQTAEESDDPFASQPTTKIKRRSADRDVVEIEDEEDNEEEEERREGIPADLLSVLLHQFFEDKTRMSKGANAAVGSYMETFVREGVARCMWAGRERREEGVVEVSYMIGEIGRGMMANVCECVG